LAGGVELDVRPAHDAVKQLGETLGLGEVETAEGIVRVANQEMVRALRVVTVERGVDPRDFALMPFGGAGPMHAAAIVADLAGVARGGLEDAQLEVTYELRYSGQAFELPVPGPPEPDPELLAEDFA